MSLGLAALHLPMPRQPGRPRADESPADRARHIECASMLFGADPKRWPVKRIAGSFEISRDTVYEWARKALGYTDPGAEDVRELAARSRRKLSAN
jgi:hypothetical protein